MAEKKNRMTEFQVTLSEEDFVAYNLIGAGFTFTSFFVYIVVVIAILANSGFYQGLTSAGFVRYIWLPAGLFILLCGAYYGYVRWRAVGFYRKTPDMAAEVRYQITNKGLNVKRDNQQKTVPWTGLYRVVGNKRVVAFFTSKANAYIIPVVTLKDAGVIDELIPLMKENIPKRRLRLPRGWYA